MGARDGRPHRRRDSLSRRGRGALLAPRVFLGLALLLGAPGLAAAAEDAPRIESIDFEGNRNLSSSQLRAAMRLRQPAWWRPFSTPRYAGQDFLATDLHAVVAKYGAAGFPFARIREAGVRYNAKGDAVRLLIAVEEGPRVRIGSVQVRGLDAKWEAEVADRSALKPGQPFSYPQIVAERDLVAQFLSDRGHPRGRTDLSMVFAGDTAQVRLDVDPGPAVRVDSIRIDPLQRTRESAVRRELTLRPGSLLLGRRVLESRQRLLDTGIFQRVRIVPEFPDSSRPVADLHILLEERKNGWYGAGVGYSSSDRLRFVSEWGLRNLGGAGRRLGLTGNLYYSLDPSFRDGGMNFREGLVQADLVEPWLWSSRTRLLLSPYLRWQQEEGFHLRTVGYSVTLRREVTRWTKISLGLESKHVWTTEKERLGRYTTRLLNLDATEDRRDNLFDPQRGRLMQGVVEYAGGLLAGTNRFARFTGSWQGYARPQKGWVLAGRVKFGGIEPIGQGPLSDDSGSALRLERIPWDERFRLGGGNTIRGYNEGLIGLRDTTGAAVGGLSMLLVNLELRFPLVSIINGGMFVDLGNVWSHPAEIKLSRFQDGLRETVYDPLNVAYGMGLGLRVTTPVGPFRFDYGFKVGSGRAPGDPPGVWHVALGQAF